MTEHRHHYLRNTSVLAVAAAGAFVYTVWRDSHADWKNYQPLTIPVWMSHPVFVPTVLVSQPEYDYDRFEMELDR